MLAMRMRSPLLALVVVVGAGACSSGADPASVPPANRPTETRGSAVADTTAVPDGHQGSQGMPQNTHPGDTGVDEHGNLLRSKPDPSAPKADPAMVADDASNLLFYAGALTGDPAVQRRVWQRLQLADASGTPTPRMTEFIRAHQEWVKTRGSVAETVATPDKARAYLDAHLK